MGHKCYYTAEVCLHGDEIVREITAHFYDKRKKKQYNEVVYREYEDGSIDGRYIEYRSLAGYVCTFAGERENSYYGYNAYGSIMPEMDFTPYYEFKSLEGEWNTKEQDIKAIVRQRPELKWLINKMPKDIYSKDFMTLIKNWKLDSKVELLVANGYMNLALSKQMAKLKPNKKKEVLTWLKNHMKGNWCLKDILFSLKHKDIDVKDLGRYASWSYDYHFIQWLDKNGGCTYQEESLYFDYKKLCKDLKKDWNDPYWSEPKDLRKAHNKVLVEHRNWTEIQEQIRLQKRQQEESERLQKKAIENAEIYKRFHDIGVLNAINNKTSKYSIYIPTELDDVVNQANVLNQCLVQCDYPAKVGKGKSLLVFVKDENQTPLATYEISYKKEILQGYANESDRNNCTPSKEIRTEFDAWLKQATFTRLEVA